MTAALVLDPVRAAAAVNGLLPVLPLPKVPCQACEGRGGYRLCVCGGSGTVPQSVPPGTYLVVASRDLPKNEPDDCVVVRGVESLTLIVGHTRWIGLYPGSVVGSVTVTAAPPIVAADPDGYCGRTDRHICIGKRFVYYDGDEPTILSSSLPWLGDPAELVGQTGVLVENAATTEQRCPNPDCMGGSVEALGTLMACPVCDGRDLWGPIPVPPHIELEAGSLIELELT